MANLSSLNTLDRILAVVSGADVAALRQISQDWTKVINEIGAGHGRFVEQTGELAGHWKGGAFTSYDASAKQAASGMMAWAQRGPERAKHVDRVVEIIEYMKWLLMTKQKNERNHAEQLLHYADLNAKRLVAWWDEQPQPKPVITEEDLKQTQVRYTMRGLDDSSLLAANFAAGQLHYNAFEIAYKHKELFDFYDKVARDIADRWGAEIKQLTPWVSPPPYIGLGKGLAPIIDPATTTPETGQKPAGPPGGGGGGGGVAKPGGGAKPPPEQDLMHELKQETRPIDRQQPVVDPPSKQDDPGSRNPQQQQTGTPPPGGVQPPPATGATPPPALTPIGGTGLPGSPPVSLPGSVPGAFVPIGSGVSALDGGSRGGGLNGAKTGGTGASPALAGRMADGSNVLNGRAAASPGQAGAGSPMYPPMAPGAGAPGGSIGGRSARTRRPVPLGGPRVVGETQVGQGKTISGRPADRKKAEPPRQADEPVTGWETPTGEEAVEQRPVERRYGV